MSKLYFLLDSKCTSSLSPEDVFLNEPSDVFCSVHGGVPIENARATPSDDEAPLRRFFVVSFFSFPVLSFVVVVVAVAM